MEISHVRAHSAHSVNSVSAVSAVSETDRQLIGNGINALWLLFADNSDHTLGWKSGDPHLTGFGLGNPNLATTSPNLLSTLMGIFQSEIGTRTAPSPLMAALSNSQNSFEYQLFEGLNYYRLHPEASIQGDIATAVGYFQKNGKYDTSDASPMGKILDIVQNYSSKSKYPITYINGLTDPTDPAYPYCTPTNFHKNMGTLQYLDPTRISTELKLFGNNILGPSNANQAPLWAMCGGDARGNSTVDPMDMLIWHILATPLTGTHYLAAYAFDINSGHPPDPSTPEGKAFFDSFQMVSGVDPGTSVPTGLGGLLAILGHYGTYMTNR